MFSCCFGKAPSPTLLGVNRASNLGINLDVSTELLNLENLRLYTYKDLRVATADFRPENKIGQGGFGSVYKGILKDGLVVAIKVLSADSTQGIREFLTEIIVISDIQHENLVKLHGYCVEKDHRILVYGYLKNGSLDQALLGNGHCSISFTWEMRRKICIGIAKGLSYLHEEAKPHIIHRDIKASNILLDEDFTPTVSDFGLAKLFPDHLTHLSTRIAGTQGYLAPEYAISGQLTRKADIYSFGILLLEIVSGRPNQNTRLPDEEQYLLRRVWQQYKEGVLERLVDTSVEKEVDIHEACRYLRIGLLCTQSLPKSRPSMSDVMKMLNDDMKLDERVLAEVGFLCEPMKYKTVLNDLAGTSCTDSRIHDDSQSDGNTTMSSATMTFTTITYR